MHSGCPEAFRHAQVLAIFVLILADTFGAVDQTLVAQHVMVALLTDYWPAEMAEEIQLFSEFTELRACGA